MRCRVARALSLSLSRFVLACVYRHIVFFLRIHCRVSRDGFGFSSQFDLPTKPGIRRCMINIPCHILPLLFLSFCCCFQGTKHRLRSHRCRQTISVYTASSSWAIPSRIVFLWEIATPTTVLIWYDDATIPEIYPSEMSGKLSARETLVTDLDQVSVKIISYLNFAGRRNS